MPQDPQSVPQRPGPLVRFRSWILGDPRAEMMTLRAEWAEYQLIFNDLLARWSAKLAREAKMEKKRLARLAEVTEPDHRAPPVLPVSPKAALRSRFAASVLAGSFGPTRPQEGTPDVNGDQTE